MKRTTLKSLLRQQRAATAIEYGLFAGGLAIGIMATIFALGGNIDELFGAAGDLVGSGSDDGDAAGLRVVLSQTFEADREGWSGMAPPRTLDQIGMGISLANESRRANAAEAVSHTFDIPAGATRAEISFDMSFVDSWDADEQAKIYVNGTEIAVGEHLWRSEDVPTFAMTPADDMTIDAQLTSSVTAGTWDNGNRGTDHTFRVTVSVDNPGETLRLGFGTSLDQEQSDESLLIGNVELRADR